MFTPSDIEKMPKQFERYMEDLENRVMKDIVRRVKINESITRSADWQILRINELKGFETDVKKYIKESLKLADDEIGKLYEEVIASGYAHDEKLYKATGKEFVAFKDNKELQQAIQAVMTQTKGELRNITQSLGFAIKLNGKISFTPMAEYYQGILDGAMMDITSGSFDYNKTIARIVTEMTKSGLRTIDYANSWSNRIVVAARRSVMTGVTQVTGKINEQNAQKLNTEYFEVSWHGTARPSHQEWQGKVYSKKELESICGLGTVGGLGGANCRHSWYPFIPGISERTYTDAQLKEMNAKENKKVVFDGKEYNSYEATQRMRKMESLMRAQRQKIKLLKEGGASEEGITDAKCAYKATSQQYTRFAKAMNLPQERARVYADGLRRVV